MGMQLSYVAVFLGSMLSTKNKCRKGGKMGGKGKKERRKGWREKPTKIKGAKH